MAKSNKGKRTPVEDRKAQAELMWAARSELTIPQIAERFGVSVRTVKYRFEEFPKENYDKSLIKLQPDHYETPPVVLSEAAKMWEDRNNGMTLDQLAEKYQMQKATVRNRLSNFYPDKPLIALEKQRNRENDKLDFLEEEALKLLGTEHVVVSHGQTIIDPRTGEPMIDSEPKFKAIDRLLKIHERRGKLNGSDAPQRAEVKHSVGEKDEEDLVELFEKAQKKQQETEARIRAALTSDGEILDAEVVSDDGEGSE